jgi:phosphoribosylformimino-5-aminoimidazole carboxamide ribotide isomerase
MRIVPAIDLKSGRCVRLTEGHKDSAKVYDGDPLDVALSFQQSGASLVHVIDLDAAFLGTASPNREIIRRISAKLDIPLQTGGGLRSASDVEVLIGELGVRYVVLGTLAVEHPEIAAQSIDRYGDSIVIGIDARASVVATQGWTVESGVSVDSLVKDMVAIGATRFIYTDITRDGKLAGPNIEMTRHIAELSGRGVTASGGVSSLDDIAALAELEPYGVDSVIVGKALYEGRFSLEQAISAANRNGAYAG